MKWYNENKTRMLDLDSINGYVFIDSEEFLKMSIEEDKIKDYTENGDSLELIIGGNLFLFRGEEAKEIYNLLLKKDKKTSVLKG